MPTANRGTPDADRGMPSVGCRALSARGCETQSDGERGLGSPADAASRWDRSGMSFNAPRGVFGSANLEDGGLRKGSGVEGEADFGEGNGKWKAATYGNHVAVCAAGG